MKKLVKALLSTFIIMLGIIPALAQADEFAGKIIKLGSNATTLETGQRYQYPH